MYDSKNCTDRTSKNCISHVLGERGYFNSCSNSIISNCNGYYSNIHYNDYFTSEMK